MSGVAAFHDFQFIGPRGRRAASRSGTRSWMTPGRHIRRPTTTTATASRLPTLTATDCVDIYFVNQVGGNQLWKNLGGGKFQNITASAGVGVPGKVSVSASFADIDNDGDPDLYVTTVRGGNMLFENDGHGRFSDISAPAGVGYRRPFISAPFSLTTTTTAGWTSSSSTSGKYTTSTIAGQSASSTTSAFEDAFSGHLKPERAERSVLYPQRGRQPFRRCRRAARACSRSVLVRRRERG